MSTARYFFNQREQKLLIEAIEKAELKTSGEIRLHLENFCFGNELKAAQRVFKKLKMHQTDERNGVLIYLACVSKKVAIVGDEGIHKHLGDSFWKEIIAELLHQFKENNKAVALAHTINQCGEVLQKYFPRKENDKDELSNEISF